MTFELRKANFSFSTEKHTEDTTTYTFGLHELKHIDNSAQCTDTNLFVYLYFTVVCGKFFLYKNCDS